VEIGDETTRFVAPIYGGPVFAEPRADASILKYLSFTEGTMFQVGSDEAQKLMLGRPAMIRCRFGDGELILAGPHLEHPRYKEANDYLLMSTGLHTVTARSPSTITRSCDLRHVERSMADLKVSVLGMEMETFLVGAKLWDGGRMLELVDAIERRMRSLDVDTAQAVSALLDESRESLLSLGPERVVDSDSAPALLVEAARLAVNCHFLARRA
jgi:hypothetical protein